MATIIEGKGNTEVKIAKKEILRLLGYKTQKKRPLQNVSKLISEEKKELQALIEPKALYHIFDRSELKSHNVFNNADKIALCVCTIGLLLEQKVARLFRENEMLRGLILDAFGSGAVEQVEANAYNEICFQAAQLGLHCSSRFSPGYGKWNLEEQGYIFKVLPGDSIGVSLTSSMMMIPRKSISFAVKLGKKNYKDKNRTACDNCDMKFTCNYRKDN